MKKAGPIEVIGGHTLTQFAASGAMLMSNIHPAAALLPSLLSAGATALMQKRVEGAISDIEARLSTMQESVQSLSDAQYNLVCEAMATLQRTNDVLKLEYLKTIVVNGF